MENFIEKITYKDKILAIISRAEAISHLESSGKKMLFVTPDEFPFQIGIHYRESGETIKPHFHIPFEKLKNFPVQEFFYVISGKIKIDLFDERENDAKVSEIIINEGDSVVLNTGHGFTFLDNAKLIEIKQGPYRGKDKEKRFLE